MAEPKAPGWRIRLARQILRGTGWEPMPCRLTEQMRAGTWLAQAQLQAGKLGMSPDVAESYAAARLADPEQRQIDHIAYDTLRDVATGRRAVTIVEVRHG